MYNQWYKLIKDSLIIIQSKMINGDQAMRMG